MLLLVVEVKHQRNEFLLASTGSMNGKNRCRTTSVCCLKLSAGSEQVEGRRDMFSISGSVKPHPAACPCNTVCTSCRCRMGKDRCARLDEQTF